MNAVGQVGSGGCLSHVKRGPPLHSNRLFPGRPSEATSSNLLREARNMGFNVIDPQVLNVSPEKFNM